MLNIPEHEFVSRHLLRYSHEVVINLDENHKITYVSPSIEHMLGYHQAQLIGRQYFDLIEDTEVRNKCISAARHAARQSGREQEPVEVRMPDIDGSEKVLEITQTHVSDTNSLVLVVQDVTRLKEIEQKMVAREKLYTAVIHNVTDVVAVLDPSGVFKFVSASYAEMTGRQFVEGELFRIDDFLKQIDPKYRESMDQHIAASFSDQEGATRDEECRLLHLDGSIRWIDVRLKSCLRDPEIAGVIVNLIDRTSQHELQHERSVYEQRLRNVLDLMPFGVTVFEMDGRASFSNREALKLNEIAVVNHKNIPISYQAGTDDKYPWVKQWGKLGNNKVVYLDDMEMERRAGGRMPFEAWISPMTHNDLGEMQKMIMITRETTERRQMEEAQKAQMMLESTNYAKSTFLTKMSHEIRTPMNAILGFSQLIALSEQLTGPQLENMDAILSSGEHLLDLIDNVMELAKIEAEQVLLDVTSFNPTALCAAVESMLSNQAETAGLDFILTPDCSLPDTLVGDECKIRQILINLLANSIKFTESGEVSLKLAWSSDEELLITVADTGPGIAKPELDKIFEPFQQVKNHNKTQPGTGLGLAICENYATLMGGTIEVDSVVGRGSVFTVRLPLSSSLNSRGQSKTAKLNR